LNRLLSQKAEVGAENEEGAVATQQRQPTTRKRWNLLEKADCDQSRREPRGIVSRPILPNGDEATGEPLSGSRLSAIHYALPATG